MMVVVEEGRKGGSLRHYEVPAQAKLRGGHFDAVRRELLHLERRQEG